MISRFNTDQTLLVLIFHYCWTLKPQIDTFSVSFFYVSGGQQKEVIVSKSDTNVLITDYKPSRDYVFSVTAVRGREQSRPLQGRFKGLFHTFFLLSCCSVLRYIVFYTPALFSSKAL